MLQSFVAWCQIISSHPTSCMVLVGDWMPPDPLPQGPPIPQRGGGLSLLIYILNLSYFPSLSYLIEFSISDLDLHSWNLFQHTCVSCLKSTFFILSYQLHCCWLEVGWPPTLPRIHSFYRGEGGWWAMTMIMAGGGRTQNLEHICIHIYIYMYTCIYICIYVCM